MKWRLLKWLFRIIGIIVALVCLLFVVKYYNYGLYYHIFGKDGITILVIVAAAAIIAAIWCVFSKPAMGKKSAVIKGVVLSIAIVVAITNSYFYYRYLPKYGQPEACDIVKADFKFSNVDYMHEDDDSPISLLWYRIKDNQFEWDGFVLDWESDEGKEGWVYFDPNGVYQITFSDDFVIKTECFTSVNKYNIFIAHGGAVEMNIYFNREQKNTLVEKYAANGTWSKETQIDYSTYLPCLSSEDVKAFILEMRGNELQGQLKEAAEKYLQHYDQVKTAAMPAASDLIIEFKLYCVDIGTYRNSSITLK